MRKTIVFLILGILFSAVAFGGAYLEFGANPISYTMMMLPGGLSPIPKKAPPVFPAYLLQQIEGIYVVPIYGHMSITADFESYCTDMEYYNSFFVSGTVGMRYTSDVTGSFLGPLRVFAGVNGGGMLLVGGTTPYPLVTADVGVSFKLTDTVNTFWDLKFYDSLWKQINFFPNPSLSGGMDFNF